MTTPLNLNRIRKERARAARRVQADGNAAKFGRSKAEKQAALAAVEKDKQHLDAHKREP